MSEVTTEIDKLRIGDIALDNDAVVKMRQLILDTSIDLPPSGRSAHENRGKMDREKLIDIGREILTLIQTSDAEVTRLTEEYIDRASKLGLSPSRNSFVDYVGGMAELNSEIGIENKNKFSTWTREDYIREGRLLANKLDRRLTARFLQKNPERFPSRFLIVKEFDEMPIFNELIGRPSFNRAKPEDIIDWGLAVIRQNPSANLVSLLTKGSIEYWSKRGKGPSVIQLNRHFKTVPEFRKNAVLIYENLEAIKQQKNEEAQKYLANSGLQVPKRKQNYDLVVLSAMHKLARNFAPNIPDSEVNMLVSRYTQGGLVKVLIKKYGAVDLADVEVAAVEMHIFDDLWPMYRFQNVDLVYRPHKNGK